MAGTHDARTQLRGDSLDDQVIDLTNMIDLLMVVCACLMILLPAYTTVTTDLAEVKATGARDDLRGLPVIRFAPDATLTWDDAPLGWEALDERVKGFKEAHPDSALVVAGDETAPYGLSLKLRAQIGKHGVCTRELAKRGEE